jgi:hypothetical protein
MVASALTLTEIRALSGGGWVHGVSVALLAACYDPVVASAISSRSDAAFAILACAALVVMRWSCLWVVLGCTIAVAAWSHLN